MEKANVIWDKFTQVDTNCEFYGAETPCCANLSYCEERADSYFAKATPWLASAHPQ